ncbi:S8 family serine peptidase [Pelovirga terrestris]|uniref:S8 family serine peptidase n=1 Tax=Pelovirga terrestris TaxID=2771352 RepID=A0A8J6QNH5_9BACT|nr:S8 family serine peptidase [Pelovirga terrestris]MBD1399566.1 S8 family serine peptidase [Pelovirga terrestris]
MPVKLILSAILGLLLTVSSPLTVTAEVISPKLQSVLDRTPSESISVIISLTTDETPVMLAKRLGPRQRSEIVRELTSVSEKNGRPLNQFLSQRNLTSARPLWLVNAMALTVSPELLAELATLSYVEAITLDEEVQLPSHRDADTSSAEWNIGRTGAPLLWQRSYDGRGITIAILDSGVNIEHPDLAGRWRGDAGDWFDPYNGSTEPYDFGGYHGTGVASVALGGHHSGSTIGMAPGASLIAAKLFRDDGTGNLSYIIEALQWVLSPGGNPERAPAVINNSWGFDDEAGNCLSSFGSGSSIYHLRTAIQTIKAAGIFVVSAAGNNGPDAATSVSPANYPESFSVGATWPDNTIAGFSSRGPSACPEDFTYPDLVAPGIAIKVAASGSGDTTSYQQVSGTSFSAPHVTGAAALLLSAANSLGLTLGVTEIDLALKYSATDLGPPGADDAYGFGLLNVANALNLIENKVLPDIAGNTPPSAPRTIIPTADTIFSTTDTITLAWEEATDQDGDELYYVVVVADNPYLNSPLDIGTYGFATTFVGLSLFGIARSRRPGKLIVTMFIPFLLVWLISCGGGGSGSNDSPQTTAYDFSQTIGPLNAGTYYWKVVVNDGRGGVSESAVVRFKVMSSSAP